MIVPIYLWRIIKLNISLQDFVKLWKKSNSNQSFFVIYSLLFRLKQSKKKSHNKLSEYTENEKGQL